MNKCLCLLKGNVDAKGCRVSVVSKVVAVYDVNGNLMRQEDIIDYTKQNIRHDFASERIFRETFRVDRKSYIS